MCFDIGYVKPGIVLIKQNNETKKLSIDVFENVQFDNNVNSVSVLDYFFSQKINKVIIEQQLTIKNVSLMWFIYGYSLGKGIDVVIKRPISFLRDKIKNEKVTRKIKKEFSVNFINKILESNKILKRYILKDSDICDAINIGLVHVFNLNKKNINDTQIVIESVDHYVLVYDN